MKKQKIWIAILLVASLGLNFYLGYLHFHTVAEQKRQEIDFICRKTIQETRWACIEINDVLNGEETDSRYHILRAGLHLEKLGDAIADSKYYGRYRTYGPGSVDSLAELIIWGDSDRGLAPLGRSGENPPLTAEETAILKKMSDALWACALRFYDGKPATENTLLYETPSCDIWAMEDALANLQAATADLF